MKKIQYICIALAALTLASCDKFLDRQEDEQMTFEKIWQQRSTTRQYFLNCMGYLPDDSEMFMNSPAIGASDEATCTWAWNVYRLINFGSWNANNLPTGNFNTYYEGIRDCNIFLSRVMTCEDSAATETELKNWYACARWARAYMYFLLMRDFGPVMLLGDEIMDFTRTTAELERPRNTWEECVDYVVGEMEWCADNLPEKQTASDAGLPTKGAALAVISRLQLYAARDLFNGNPAYRTMRNPDGTNLFPVEYDPQKWVEAAQAAKAVIDLGAYELYYDEKDPTNPYLNYYGITQKNWNEELIYCGGGYRSRAYPGPAVHTAPRFLSVSGTAYGGWAPTQQQVDAYAMANGRYPIMSYDRAGVPVVDAASGYPSVAGEFSLVSVSNPFLSALGAPDATATSSSPAMYRGREPRFYVNVYWPGSQWKHGDQYHAASFTIGGEGRGTAHDYPKSGYMVNRFYDHTQNSYAGQWGYMTFPTFRLGEIYLNYIEAAIECELNGVTGEGISLDTAKSLWDELRARSGVPSVSVAYPDATTEDLLDLVRRERRVELSQEGHRYYDTRTWKIATETDNGPMYGLNIDIEATGSDVPNALWQRHVFETRVFRANHYLYPFPQRELDRNHQLTQNYGW
ncbi:MAG: RagB/SusD family nutrient uptake outer membrane protein [Bacteroidales bacterium]|nr:RagB/SusD family nutrient uptake outer membrane protein [Bacteroidales bacterium]